jgi:hypothetical protein
MEQITTLRPKRKPELASKSQSQRNKSNSNEDQSIPQNLVEMPILSEEFLN